MFGIFSYSFDLEEELVFREPQIASDSDIEGPSESSSETAKRGGDIAEVSGGEFVRRTRTGNDNQVSEISTSPDMHTDAHRCIVCVVANRGIVTLERGSILFRFEVLKINYIGRSRRCDLR